MQLSDERKILKKNKSSSDEARKQNNKLTKEIRRKARICTSEWLERQCSSIEQASRKHEARTMFKKVQLICRYFSAKSTSVQTKQGNLIQDKEDIKKRWNKHFEELYNAPNQMDESILYELPSTNDSAKCLTMNRTKLEKQYRI